MTQNAASTLPLALPLLGLIPPQDFIRWHCSNPRWVLYLREEVSRSLPPAERVGERSLDNFLGNSVTAAQLTLDRKMGKFE
jgi:hypothetical protein